MVITNHFVFLHNPKTGGTFCEKIIERLYRQTNRERLSNLIRLKPVRFCKNFRQHKGLRAVPRYARHLPLLGSIRNPYDRWVSQYEYQPYRIKPSRLPSLEDIRKAYPTFPDVIFPDFIQMVNRFWDNFQSRHNLPPEDRLGYYSVMFIRLFCNKPSEILKRPKSEITADLVRANMPSNITILKTENLNRELHEYLARFNHDQADLDAILESPKILPINSGTGSLREPEAWKGYYTPEAVELINEKESLIFDLFPHFKMEAYDESWKAYERPYKYQSPIK